MKPPATITLRVHCTDIDLLYRECRRLGLETRIGWGAGRDMGVIVRADRETEATAALRAVQGVTEVERR